MTQRRPLPLHPFLLVLYPFVLLYGVNFPEVAAAEALLPALVSLAVTGVALLLCSLAFRGWSRGALFVSLAVCVFFTYGHVYSLLQGWALGRHRYLLTITALILGVGLWALRWWRGDPGTVTRLVNLVATCLVLFPTGVLAARAMTPVPPWHPPVGEHERRWPRRGRSPPSGRTSTTFCSTAMDGRTRSNDCTGSQTGHSWTACAAGDSRSSLGAPVTTAPPCYRLPRFST